MLKKCTRCGAKHMWKKKFQSPFGSWDVEKCTPLWGEAHFEVKMYKTHHARSTFGSWDDEKSARPCGAKHMSSQKCKKLAVSEHFLRLGCGFAWQAQESPAPSQKWAKRDDFVAVLKKLWQAWDMSRASAKMHVAWQAQYKRLVQAISSALNFPFLKDVSQNCFVFDVVHLENWGSLAELLRFWRCQVRKLRKFRTIAAFGYCQVQKIEESCRLLRFQACT